MDNDDFQCVQGNRGLNTNRSNHKFSLSEDDNVRICWGLYMVMMIMHAMRCMHHKYLLNMVSLMSKPREDGGKKTSPGEERKGNCP